MGTPKPEVVAEPKTNKPSSAKPRRRGKGDNKSNKTDWQSELDAYAGKGRAANKEVASVLRKHNMSVQIGSEGWTYWESIR